MGKIIGFKLLENFDFHIEMLNLENTLIDHKKEKNLIPTDKMLSLNLPPLRRAAQGVSPLVSPLSPCSRVKNVFLRAQPRIITRKFISAVLLRGSHTFLHTPQIISQNQVPHQKEK